MPHFTKDQQAGNLAGRECILILGMHRSGTSALAGAMNLLGYEFGEGLIPALSSNPKGHYEKQSVVRLNDRILAALGVTWEDVFKIPQLELRDHHFKDEFKPQIRQILNDEFSFEKPVVIKDPRLCVVLPFWKECLDEMGITSHFLILNRHPYEVCKSLQIRNNLDWGWSEKLWVYYTLALEFHTRDLHRLIINHEDFLVKTVSELKRVTDFLGIDSSFVKEREIEITDFVNAGLVNSDFRKEKCEAHLSPEPLKIFEIIQAAHKDNNALKASSLDIIRDQLISKKYFTQFDYEPSVRVSFFNKNGKVQEEIIRIREGLNILDIALETKDEIERIVCNPCNSECVVELKEIKITNLSGEKVDVETFTTNASIGHGKKFLFNTKSPSVRIYPKLKLFEKITIKAYYEILGERSSKQFIIYNLGKQIGYESYKSVVDFNIIDEFRDKTEKNEMMLREIKRSFSFRLGNRLMKPFILLRDIFR